MVTLYRPELTDLWFRQLLLSDPATMSFNHAWGGTIDFPRERWKPWYDRWVGDSTGSRFYRYIADSDGRFVGEAACHLDAQRQIWLADIIILASARRCGYGRAGLKLLCDAARGMGISVLYDEIAADNPSVQMFERCGFVRIAADQDRILVRKRLDVPPERSRDEQVCDTPAERECGRQEQALHD